VGLALALLSLISCKKEWPDESAPRAQVVARHLVIADRPYGLSKDFALDGQFVYWAEQTFQESMQRGPGPTQIVRMSRRGGTIDVLAEGGNRPTHLTLDGDFLYWLGQSSEPGSLHRLIYRVPKRGGDRTSLPDPTKRPQSSIGSFVPANGTVYFPTPTKILASAPGQPIRVLADDQRFPRRLLIDGEYIYWNSDHGVLRHSLVGEGGVESITTEPGAMLWAVDDDRVFWLSGDGRTLRWKENAGQGGAIAYFGASGAVASNVVYIIENSTRQIRAIDLGPKTSSRGSGGRLIADIGDNGDSLVVDKNELWWIERERGFERSRLLRISIPPPAGRQRLP